MAWLRVGSIDPAVWGFLGVCTTAIVGALALILVELIRNRKSTDNVREVVTTTQDATTEHLVKVAADVATVKTKLEEHIRWHENDRHRLIRIGDKL